MGFLPFFCFRKYQKFSEKKRCRGTSFWGLIPLELKVRAATEQIVSVGQNSQRNGDDHD